jgi:hypothetical protein
MIGPTTTDEPIKKPRVGDGPVEALLRLTATARLLRSADGRAYARVSAGDRRETYPLRSAAFRDWLIDQYSRTCHQVPSDWSIRRVTAVLEATARFGAGAPDVCVRIGKAGDGIDSAWYLDLADPSSQAIQIGAEGWSVVDNPPVHFRRPAGHLPLPTPSREGSIELLRPYVNLTDADFRLLVVWMAAAHRPVGPYPILALYGQQGTSKTTLARIVRRLIDPQSAPLLAEPRHIRALLARALNSWVVAYDNVGVLSDWLSDGLCLLSTGGAFESQASFVNDEGSLIHVQGPVILTGTEEFVRRGDLADRAVFLELPPIDSRGRRREDEFWSAFDRDYPRILGGLLDAVVGGLRQLPSLRLTELPRMADFAAFAEAVGRGLGWPDGMVLEDYNENRRQATTTLIEGSLVGFVLLEYARYLNDWIGTADELLCKLNAFAGRIADSPHWPKSPVRLARELRRVAPQLRIHDIFVVFHRTNTQRLISISTADHAEKLLSPDTSVTGAENYISDSLGQSALENLPSLINSNPANDLSISDGNSA